MTFIPPPPYEWIRALSERVQLSVLKTKSDQNLWVGLVLAAVSFIGFFSGSFWLKEGVYISTLDLIFKHRLPLPIAYVVLHASIFLVLLTRHVDRFRYASLFTVAILFLIMGPLWMEIESRFPSARPLHAVAIWTFPAVLVPPWICIIIFGLQSMKTEPKNPFFRLTWHIGGKIQYFFDNHAEKDIMVEMRKLLRECRKRRS